MAELVHKAYVSATDMQFFIQIIKVLTKSKNYENKF